MPEISWEAKGVWGVGGRGTVQHWLLRGWSKIQQKRSGQKGRSATDWASAKDLLTSKYCAFSPVGLETGEITTVSWKSTHLPQQLNGRTNTFPWWPPSIHLSRYAPVRCGGVCMESQHPGGKRKITQNSDWAECWGTNGLSSLCCSGRPRMSYPLDFIFLVLGWR